MNRKTLTKIEANGIPLITFEYHSVLFSIIGPFNDISAGLSDTLNGNLKYHSIPLNCTKNPKYHSKNHSDTIQILLAIIPQDHSSTIQIPGKTISPNVPGHSKWHTPRNHS